MSIVKMKRVRVIGLEEEKQELLQQLLSLGCVEISEPEEKITDPQWAALLRRDTSDLTDCKAEGSALTAALDALNRYAPEKKGLFRKRSPISEAEFFSESAKADALATAEEINDSTREIARIFAAENKLAATLASLTPWASLDLPLETTETEQTEVMLGTVPAAAELTALQAELAQATELATLIPVSADKDQQYLLLLAHKSEADLAVGALRSHSFSVVRFKDMTGTAARNIDRLKAEQQELEQARQAQEAAIAAQKDRRRALELTLDRVNQDISRETVSERFLTDGRIFFAEGWIPAERVADLDFLLGTHTAAWEAADPAEGETPPTLLKNPKWMDSINMVTEMYSLPAYNGIDPNPLMFFWYVFFFGIMFADVAYGIVLFLVSFIIIKKFNPKKTMGRMFHLGLWLGASTAICGVFVGGFFGNALEVIYQNFVPGGLDAMPAWMAKFCAGLIVNPVNDPMTVLILAIIIGCFHLLMGQCIHIYMGFRDGQGVDALLDVVPWWIVFAGIAVAALAGTPIVLILGALALICTQGRHEQGFFKKLFGGVKSLYDITSWLSDVLSYARLMALMLATSVIAQVFNTLGALPRNIIVFILVFLIGHVFNIGVNVIGTYVHAARLQYLEYFGKFYKDGGIPFRPLQYDTKYVDITNKEEN
ncbi:MAG: V-type ATP synthase subunit I [Oscillospiraceae bacterium]|nr:V-type ATP synthase subunit I [Oscillospiraceae bacterium]